MPFLLLLLLLPQLALPLLLVLVLMQGKALGLTTLHQHQVLASSPIGSVGSAALLWRGAGTSCWL